MSKQRVRVTISDSKLIPTIGKGPINKPISITVPQYEMLKKFGFNIAVHSEQPTKIEKVTEAVVEATSVVEQPVEVTESEEVVEETVEVEEATVEVVEESSEEVVEEDGDVIYTEEDLKEATKKELKEVLDGRGVEYKYNATVPELKELVISSNPTA
jgi:hypothetical protein